MQIKFKKAIQIQKKNHRNSQIKYKIMMQLLKDLDLRVSKKKRKKQKLRRKKLHLKNLLNLLLKYFTMRKKSNIQKKYNNKISLMIL